MDSFIFFLEVLKSERTGLKRKPNDYLLYREKKYLYIFLEHLWHSRTVEKSHAMNGLLFADKRFGSNGKSASKVWREISCQKIRDWNCSSLIINIYLWNTTLYWDYIRTVRSLILILLGLTVMKTTQELFKSLGIL